MADAFTRADVAKRFWWALHRDGDIELALEFVFELGRSSGGPAVASVSGMQLQQKREAQKAARTREALVVGLPVVNAIARNHDVSVEKMLRRYTRGAAAQALFEAMWVLREMGFSYPDIAEVVERKSHADVIRGVRKVEARIKARPALRRELLEFVPGERAPLLRSVG
jgi:hypothetical protein